MEKEINQEGGWPETLVPASYDQLYNMYFEPPTGRVYRRLHRHFETSIEADEKLRELMQEMFLKCMHRDILGQYRGGDFISFIMRITEKIILEYLRDLRYQKERKEVLVDIDSMCSGNVDTEQSYEIEAYQSWIQNTLKHTAQPERTYANRELVTAIYDHIESQCWFVKDPQHTEKYIRIRKVLRALITACDASNDLGRKVKTGRNSKLNSEICQQTDLKPYQVSRVMGHIKSLAQNLSR